MKPTQNRKLGFWLIAGSFFAVVVGTILPTPLYVIYEQRFAFPQWVITLIYSSYAMGVIVGLLLFGHLSDEIGRRRVLFPGIAFSALSAVAFLLANGLPLLFVGRVFSGLSAGVFTSAATAALVDLAPEGRRAFAAIIAITMNEGGKALGVLLSGLLAEYAPLPLRLIYAIDLLLTLLAAAAVARAPEPITPSTTRVHLRLQRLRFPIEIRSLFIKTSIVGAGAFAAAGVFSAVAPSFLAVVLHRHNHGLAGFLVFLLFAFATAGQVLVDRVPPRAAFRIACTTLVAGLGVLAAAIALEVLVLLLISAAVVGFGLGLAVGFGLARINERVSEQRGEVTSTYFVILYIGLTLPVIGVGFLAAGTSLTVAGLAFCAIVGAAILGVLFTLLRHPAAG